jgi:LmbE family N-acetylglucosaminyl deacetylase
MHSLKLSRNPEAPINILCLGAHSDDIEIGCGGTILRLAYEYPNCSFQWVVFSAIGVREAEARRAAESFAGASGRREPVFKTFPDGFMPFAGAEIKRVFEDLKHAISPELIFTPYRKDAHQDHRLIGELTWNTFRDHMILEYEIPKYDGDIGQPNVFVPLDHDTCQQKVHFLMDAFTSQRAKRWFEESTFLSLLRLRGMECNAPSGYAEAFHCRKLVL